MTRRRFAIIGLLCNLYLFCLAQGSSDNHDREWGRIDSLFGRKGLAQSALDEVNKLYLIAKKEKNDPQIIKSLIYQFGLQENKEENAPLKSILRVEHEIAAAKEPARSILQSIEAEIYWNYFQQSRWKLYNRKTTSQIKKEDPITWSIEDFHKKIGEEFSSSIKNEGLLHQIKLEAFDAIVIQGNTRRLRPTLYDLLAHRALDYFKNDEAYLTKPAYSFELNEKTAFSDAETFIKYHFVTRDSLSNQFKAVQLFQRLLLFHQHDARRDAFIDLDIERIEFVNTYGVMDNKEELYQAALEALIAKYETLPVAAKASYLLAQIYATRAGNYDPLKDTSNRFAYLDSKAICEKIIRQTDSSEGKTACLNLLREIQRKELTIQTEKVNLPGKPFRTLISFRNFTHLYFRLIKMDQKLKESVGIIIPGTADYLKAILTLPFLKTFDQFLPDTKDYQKHSVEIKVDSIQVGEYALLASLSSDFSLENNPMAVQFLNVSKIAYIHKGEDYFVLDRETGKPLPGTDVQIWYRYYDNRQNKYLQRQGENFFTGKNGYFRLIPSKTKTDNGLRIELTKDKDHLFLDDEETNYYDYRNIREENEAQSSKEKYEKNHLTIFFFIDRSIYRPGQTVNFKGIAVTRDFESKQFKILPHFKSRTYLMNANKGKTDSLDVSASEFGSFSGKFILPLNLLNGEFRIRDDSSGSEQSFSVEEYKRPRFHVVYEKLKGLYKLNDSIAITGIARPYWGNAVGGAMVKYRVVRQTRFGYYVGKGWRPTAFREMEVTNGNTITNKDGKFFISFKAIPDPTIQKDLNPVFDYKINTDITDINGETRSGETTVPVSYKSLQIIIGIPGQLPVDSLNKISILTQNLMGEFERSLVKVKLFRLQSPSRLIRKRYWEQPDLFVMNRAEYLSYFPHDEYDNESDYHNWPRTAPVIESEDSSRDNEKFFIAHPSPLPGWYAIEATSTDRWGEEIKDIRYIQLYDEKNNILAFPEYCWEAQRNNPIEPGEKSTISIGSSANDLFVIQQIEKKDSASYSFIPLSTEKKSFDFSATENDRGGYQVFFAFVKDNRFYSLSNRINIPWTNKDLKISYETYRDKTLPGNKEKWKIKISGFKQEKRAAEVLSSMYDASLDQFRPHDWGIPDLFIGYSPRSFWSGESNFSSVQAQDIRNMDAFLQDFTKQYDEIISISRIGKLGYKPVSAVRGVVIRGAPSASMAFDISRKMAISGLKVEMAKFTSPKIVNDEEVKEKGKSVHSNGENFQTPLRKNFNETAFFFPDLLTDSSGNIEFSFTIPEALTSWKWMNLAHTKDLQFGYSERTILTQKQLMVQPNAPRFLREGDRIDFSAKIVNLTDSEITGQTELQLFDPVTNQPVDGWFQNIQANQYFTAGAGESVNAVFPLSIPFQFNKPVLYRIFVRAAAPRGKGEGTSLTDGEEAVLPVVSNRIMVTETVPLNIQGTGKKNIKFEKLLKSAESPTLNHHRLTVDFTGNPSWYAVEALPYLMEFPQECAEQTFNRFYANALASKITNSTPVLLKIFEGWKKADTSALLNNLQKNQELKAVLLQETPWVLQAQDEAQQKNNIALLFDLSRMSRELESTLGKLKDMQSGDGAFAWFKDGPDDRYITQYILTGFGHLKKLNALPPSMTEKINTIVSSALGYLDKKMKEDYDEMIRHNQERKQTDPGKLNIQYLYMRSFFPESEIPGNVFSAVNYFRKQTQQNWIQQNKFLQGMIALSLYRTGDKQKAKDILASLKQNAIVREESGMYWKDMTGGYYWDQAPVETASLLIEAFNEIGDDKKSVSGIKTWLLKQKQTQNWKTTKATADACYAILLQGGNWLEVEPQIEIRLGNKIIRNSDNHVNSGEGHFKKVFEGPFVNASMGAISISASSSSKEISPGWGAVYWQYFEDLDKITEAASPLKLSKKLFLEKNSERGPLLEPVTENGTLQPGDKVIVRIELRNDRDLEYVHMKDMRASCMEPINVLSSYKWQGGLGYYETTQDASTNFFFNWLPKGVYIFEYPMFVTHAGNFSNGITTIQCMYAPEFSSHSDGLRIKVE